MVKDCLLRQMSFWQKAFTILHKISGKMEKRFLDLCKTEKSARKREKKRPFILSRNFNLVCSFYCYFIFYFFQRVSLKIYDFLLYALFSVLVLSKSRIVKRCCGEIQLFVVLLFGWEGFAAGTKARPDLWNFVLEYLLNYVVTNRQIMCVCYTFTRNCLVFRVYAK